MSIQEVTLHQLENTLELVEGTGSIAHRLAGRTVLDGERLELLTDSGWISGHYRPRLHPETGGVGFEMHVRMARCDQLAHVATYIPHDAIVRWPPMIP